MCMGAIAGQVRSGHALGTWQQRSNGSSSKRRAVVARLGIPGMAACVVACAAATDAAAHSFTRCQLRQQHCSLSGAVPEGTSTQVRPHPMAKATLTPSSPPQAT
jgi:hypothetical protein